MDPPVVVDSLLHVTILWGVLLIFFKLVGSKDSTEAFTGGIRALIRSDLGRNPSLKRVMSTPVARRAVGSSNYKALKAIYARPDGAVHENNTWLFRAGFMGLGAMVLVLVALVWSGRFESAPLGFARILQHNAVVFAAVGLVEFLFITRIVLRINPAPPSVMTGAAIAAAKSALP